MPPLFWKLTACLAAADIVIDDQLAAARCLQRAGVGERVAGVDRQRMHAGRIDRPLVEERQQLIAGADRAGARDGHRIGQHGGHAGVSDEIAAAVGHDHAAAARESHASLQTDRSDGEGCAVGARADRDAALIRDGAFERQRAVSGDLHRGAGQDGHAVQRVVAIARRRDRAAAPERSVVNDRVIERDFAIEGLDEAADDVAGGVLRDRGVRS
jgi:hypothetical protein